MKKRLLTLIACFAITGASFAQFTYVDFETVNPTGYVFGGNGYEPGVANPDNTGNTSAKVGKVVTGPETWAGMAMPIGGTISFSATSSKFTMDVLSDVTGQVVFKIENASNTEEAAEVQGEYTTANQWQTVEFDFGAAMEAGKFSQLVLFFNFGTTEETTWFFDNVKGPDAAMSSNVSVNLKVNDKLGVANSLVLNIAGEDVSLTQDGKIWSATKALSPYNIVTGGGEYLTYVKVNGANVDTTTIIVAGGAATMDWNYLLLNESPEDGTAQAISVGTTPPVIDGDIDAIWNNAKVHPLQQRAWWGSPTGLYSYYKIMWDIDNVYVLNYVEDETLTNASETSYENDNVEIFFDMNLSKKTPFDADDFQIRCVWNKDIWTGSATVENGSWPNAVKRAQKTIDGNKGYIVEWAIPWTSLSSTFLPLATFKFGFDVVVSDVADAAGRDYIISWSTTQDVNYQNTAYYGEITLSDATAETSVNREQVANLNVYPNPASGNLNITAATKIATAQIYDITGRKIIDNTVNAPYANLNISSLITGIYVIKITDVQGNISSRKIQVQ